MTTIFSPHVFNFILEGVSMPGLNNFSIQEYHLLEAELFIARLRKWMVCLGLAIGLLFTRIDSLSAAQGLAAGAAVYYSFQVEGYYRSSGARGLKHLSAILDLALIGGLMALWTDFEYHYLGLFFVNALFLAIRFAVSGWPWLLANAILFVLALYLGGHLNTTPLEVVWILLVSALGAWLAQEHRQMDNRFLALNRLSQLFNSTLREGQVLETTVRELDAGWPGGKCHVAELSGDGEFIVVASSRNTLPGKLELGSDITAILVEKQKPVVIKNTLQDKRLAGDFLNKFYLKSVILAPVVVKGRTTGLVILESQKIRDFNHDELTMAMLTSGQMGISLENARLYERMERLACIDELTNIYNRRAFYEVAESELVNVRQKTLSFSLIMMDIDFFKQINDRWGHLAGDHVLARVAELMKQNLRPRDSVARYGGEEFVIILPEADGRTAIQVAERIRRAVEEVSWLGGMKVTVSAGVASYPENGADLEELLRNADLALYNAKSGGRNQVRHMCSPSKEIQARTC